MARLEDYGGSLTWTAGAALGVAMFGPALGVGTGEPAASSGAARDAPGPDAAGPILLPLAVSSDPLQPRRILGFKAGVLLVAVSSGLLRIDIRMERNEILGLVSKTGPYRWAGTRPSTAGC